MLADVNTRGVKIIPRRQVVDAMKMGIHKSRDPKQPPSELSKLVKASKAAERFPKLFAAGEPKAHLEITKKHTSSSDASPGRARPRVAGKRATLTRRTERCLSSRRLG